MLGLFSAKSNHPLADAKEAKRLFAEFAEKDGATVLDDAIAWLESLATEQLLSLEQRFDIVQQMDAAVMPAASRFARDYAAAVPASRNEEIRQWRLAHEYWLRVSTAYETCLTDYLAAPNKIREALKPNLALLCARLLHSYAARLKWQQFRYGPVQADIWQSSGNAYIQANMLGVAQKTCMLYANSPRATTPEGEYLKALAFHASSMDSLLPQEIEIAERLLDELLPQFQFGAQEKPDSVYWVDAATNFPPMRLAKKPSPAPTVRYFSPGQALDAAYALQKQAGQTLPPALNLGGSYSAPRVISVLEHLAAYWSPVPPQRSHTRHRVKSRMGVVIGLAGAYACLTAKATVLSEESWVVEDVSQGGMRAQAALSTGSRLSVNTLLAMKPEGGDNWLLGVVRRFTRDSEVSGSVGIETIAKQPQALCVDSGGIQTEVILLDDWETSATVRVVLPATAWEDNIAMNFHSKGRAIRLFPDAQVQSGPDYLIGRYRVRVAE